MPMRVLTGVTAEYVRSRLDYNPETGEFTWRAKPGSGHYARAFNTQYAGTTAGTRSWNGYIRIALPGASYSAHRLAWLHFYGEWPPEDMRIDHIDRNRVNNRISNLRLATNSQNRMNSGLFANNTSGFKGVQFDRSFGKFVARLRVDGRDRYVGCFDRAEDAAQAYRSAAIDAFGDFAKDVVE